MCRVQAVHGSIEHAKILYPILFFPQFIRFCGAHKCGGPLALPDGKIESTVTLEESGAEIVAEVPSPHRATVAAEQGTAPQPRSRGRGGRARASPSNPPHTC